MHLLDTRDTIIPRDQKKKKKKYKMGLREDNKKKKKKKKKPGVEWHGVVWFSAAIPKHAFFLWLAFQDALTTREKMCRWGYTGDILCLFCSFKQESLAHIFFECSFSRRIWRSIMADYKVLDPPNDWDLIVKWSSAGMKGKNLYSTARKLCFAATVYNLWMQRNCGSCSC
jgi:hypothetical protein